MRKLILFVASFWAAALLLCPAATVTAGDLIPSWESESGNLGFYPISNEISYYKNYDDAGDDRGETVQIISINAFRLFTDFSFEFTGDFNFDFTPGLRDDHYIELSPVKPVHSVFSLNVQRIISSFENEPINQFGVRVSF